MCRYIHAYIHTYVHTYIHIYIYIYIGMCIYIYIRMYGCMYVYVILLNCTSAAAVAVLMRLLPLLFLVAVVVAAIDVAGVNPKP